MLMHRFRSREKVSERDEDGGTCVPDAGSWTHIWQRVSNDVHFLSSSSTPNGARRINAAIVDIYGGCDGAAPGTRVLVLWEVRDVWSCGAKVEVVSI